MLELVLEDANRLRERCYGLELELETARAALEELLEESQPPE